MTVFTGIPMKSYELTTVSKGSVGVNLWGVMKPQHMGSPVKFLETS